MRRNAFGATNRPLLARPGNGYGRPTRRCPGPMYDVVPAPSPDPRQFCAPIPTPQLVWTVARNLEPGVVWDGTAVQDAATIAVPDIPAADAASEPTRSH